MIRLSRLEHTGRLNCHLAIINKEASSEQSSADPEHSPVGLIKIECVLLKSDCCWQVFGKGDSEASLELWVNNKSCPGKEPDKRQLSV